MGGERRAGVDAGRGPAAESRVPVLEIGGTHVVAGLVDVASGRIVEARRHPLDSTAEAEQVVARLVAAAAPLGDHPRWGVAVPGPFDYEAGVARFRDVGKFDALDGYDLGAALRDRLPGRPGVVFLNDAAAFGIGEAGSGAGVGASRLLCLTLGTGVGSAFMDRGSPVTTGPDVPPDGSVHLLTWRGRPLEETVSRRGVRGCFAALGGPDWDVHEIASAAGRGDPIAIEAMRRPFMALGSCLAPWVDRFEVERIVLGGSIARSFAMVCGPLAAGIASGSTRVVPQIRPASRPESSALVGAAVAAFRSR